MLRRCDSDADDACTRHAHDAPPGRSHAAKATLLQVF
jgi:hypothetical protein